MSQKLTVRLEHHRGVPVVTVAGDLDLYSARQMYLQGQELVDTAFSEAASPTPSSTSSSAPESTVIGDRSATVRFARRDASAGGPVVRGEGNGSRGHVQRSTLVLDLSGVAFADSAGVGSIIGVLRRARDHGADLSLAGVNPQLMHVLHVMGLDKVMTLHATVQDATKATSLSGRSAVNADNDTQQRP